MTNQPRIAVIGGTGKAGKYLVRELLRQKYPVKLLLRDPDKVPDASVEVVAGSASDPGAVSELVQGCRAVVSTLGQPAGAPPVFSGATAHVLRAMQEHGVRRYIVVTGVPVDAPTDRKGTWTQNATDWMKENYPETTRDKQLEYELLTQSTLDWTLLRLPWIQLTDNEDDVQASLEDCPGEAVSAGALARFIVRELEEGTFVQQAPFAANP